MRYLLAALSVLALVCFVAGVSLIAYVALGPVAGAGCGFLAGALALVVLAWQVEKS